MTLEQPTDKEVEEAVKYMEELRKDPIKFEHWVDKVMDGWLKRKSSRRYWKTSKRR